MVDGATRTADEPKSERTVLLGKSDADIHAALVLNGFKVATWPQLALQPPSSFTGLDEAIENLFGYDWLIFANDYAVRFFLTRFNDQGHNVNEMDSLRVCAIGEHTSAALEQSQVHVDVIAVRSSGAGVMESIATYAGGRDHLRRLNVLIPQASIGREYLKPACEDAEARADVVVAYQTVASSNQTRLTAVQTLLLTESIEAVVFANQDEVVEFCRLFDTKDLSQLLKTKVIACDEMTKWLLRELGVSVPISVLPQASIVNALKET